MSILNGLHSDSDGVVFMMDTKKLLEQETHKQVPFASNFANLVEQ